MPLYTKDDFLSLLHAPEVAVTGATTATIDRMHVISGTAADYTVTLPAAAGNVGRLLGFRVAGAAAASKIYTLDGNSSETIDGATTRLLWAEESAILLCDGSNWFKVAGKSRPMAAQMFLTAISSALASATVTKIDVDDTGFDNTGLMADETNKRINIKRAGRYLVKGGVNFCAAAGASLVTAIPRGIVIVQKNATTTVVQAEDNGIVGSYCAPSTVTPVDLAAADHLQLYYYQDGGATDQRLSGGADYYDITTLNCVEVPSW